MHINASKTEKHERISGKMGIAKCQPLRKNRIGIFSNQASIVFISALLKVRFKVGIRIVFIFFADPGTGADISIPHNFNAEPKFCISFSCF